MLLDLSKRLQQIDKDLSLEIKYDGMFITLSVRSNTIGELYSYSCTDTKEAYDKVFEYTEALVDPSKFDKLYASVCNELFV